VGAAQQVRRRKASAPVQRDGRMYTKRLSGAQSASSPPRCSRRVNYLVESAAEAEQPSQRAGTRICSVVRCGGRSDFHCKVNKGPSARANAAAAPVGRHVLDQVSSMQPLMQPLMQRNAEQLVKPFYQRRTSAIAALIRPASLLFLHTRRTRRASAAHSTRPQSCICLTRILMTIPISRPAASGQCFWL
jgi:hypothetical protein